MRAGKLDRIVSIERASTSVGPGGVPIETWATVATVRAQIVQASAEAFIRAYGESSEVATVFRMRFLDGVTLADRVGFEGRAHDIVEIKEIGRRRGLELRTLARGAT